MKNRNWIFIFCALVLSRTVGMSDDRVFTVRYLSAEHVYLDGGSTDGLAVGHRLTLTRKNGCTSELEVVFVAERSASCTMNYDSCNIAVGDQVRLISPIPVDTVAPSVADSMAVNIQPDSAAESIPKTKSYARPSPPRLTGSAGLVYYSWNDQGASNLDFHQTTARMNLKARRLFGRELTFNLRVRGRYDQRQRAYSSEVERDAWENRIWEMSLVYDDPGSDFNLAAGRILPRRVAGAGYLDGLLIERKMGERVRIGVLAGTAPQWAYDPHTVSLQKGGGYISYISGEPGSMYLEQTLAGIGEYHAGQVSRELVTLQGRFNRSSQYGVSHAVELDINRGWRKERAGESISISSLYMGAWYRFTPRLRATISYDNRVNYWTYDSRSTVDSLFDDHIRQGVRGQIDATLPAHFQSSIGFGLRKRQGDSDPTISYSANLHKSGLWRKTARGSFQYSGFDGPFERGYNYSARLSDYIAGSVLVGVGYGSYSYKADTELSHRTSDWYEITGQADLGRRYFFGMSVQVNSGDDIDGLRLQSEIGWRF